MNRLGNLIADVMTGLLYILIAVTIGVIVVGGVLQWMGKI